MQRVFGFCLVCLFSTGVAAQNDAGKNQTAKPDSPEVKELKEFIKEISQRNFALESAYRAEIRDLQKKLKENQQSVQTFQAIATARQSESESLRHQLDVLSKEFDRLVFAGGDKKKEGLPQVKRGPEYKVLESLVGTFDAQVKLYIDPTDPKIPPKESKGVLTRKMVLGGNFLQESYKGEFFGSAFTGMGMIGFDANQKKYVNTWFDSMSTAPMILYGTYDADKKTFTMVGDDFDPMTKKKMKARDVLTIESAEKQSFAMFRQPEGAPGEIKVMDISYTKRKAEKDK